MILPDATVIEWVWAVMGGIALVVSLLNLRQAVLNQRALIERRVTDRGFRITARLNVRREGVIAFVQFVLVFAAARALFHPSLGGGSWDSLALSLLLIGVQIALLWVSVTARHDTKDLLRLYRTRRAKIIHERE